MTTLTKAFEQWSSRAPDERFDSIESMHGKAAEFRALAATSKVRTNQLRAIADGSSLKLAGPNGNSAGLTNWGFSQLAQTAAAPASYLRTLPATLAADCVNNGLAGLDDSDETALLFKREPDGLTARALTSEKYSRIWNVDVTARLVDLKAAGEFREAPAAFDGSRGQYLSDRDMFSFFVDNERRIFETDPNGGLSRGFFVWNSEVGAASFGIMTFYYEWVCGNHRVWGASNVIETRIRHVGNHANPRAWALMAKELHDYADSSITEDEAAIKRARTHQIAATKSEVLDAVFALRIPGVTRKVAEQAYAIAEDKSDWYGSPRTVWGFNGGLTQVARDLPIAAERVELERASSKIMALSF